jgi:hypothetical protein
MGACIIPECETPSYAHGLCMRHYTRRRRHGDPMKGRCAPGSVAKFLSEVVFRHAGDDCIAWPFSTTQKGYATFKYEGRPGLSVTRYICATLYGPAPAPTHQAAHSCGNNGCVNPRHLRWATPQENMADQLLHGTRYRGIKHHSAKLSEADILAIRQTTHRSSVELGSDFGVSQSLIVQIKKRRVWSWL